MHAVVQLPRFVGRYRDRDRRGVRCRPPRDFRPDHVAVQGLERRVVPSTSAGGAGGAVHALQRSSLSYPTPAGPGERLNVYVPPGPAPAGGRPVIIAIHGGGWRRSRARRATAIGSPRSSCRRDTSWSRLLNYELSTPRRPSWPANLDDVRSVVAWIRSGASTLGIDPNRVAAVGESAGGNLAELLGTDPGASGTGTASTRVNAVISFSGT